MVTQRYANTSLTYCLLFESLLDHAQSYLMAALLAVFPVFRTQLQAVAGCSKTHNLSLDLTAGVHAYIPTEELAATF